ncbi:MAG TPA: LuxR C-terminal-related transcriptional regulator [Candidatus Limnocylindrales bacterium]|nr:LuxR C-terminal-related transcriptional regulator [Candidatus Limnocylindrales bacterium]
MSPTSARLGSEPTARELSVLRMLAVDGRSHRQIADELEISPHTVRFHIERLRRRVGAATIAQATWLLRDRLEIAS